MVQRKVSNELVEADTAANLADDEAITISNVKTITKGKVLPKTAPPVLEIDDEYDEDDDTGYDSPYRDGTAAHDLWLRHHDPDFEESEDVRRFETGNVLVVRHADSPNEQFLTPCMGRMSYPPLRNLDLANLTKNDIEEMVRSVYKGGHYYLQYRIGNSTESGWKVDLADDPAAIARAASERIAGTAPAANPLPPEPIDPFASMLKNLSMMRELKDGLYGDDQRRMEAKILELQTKLDIETTRQPPEPQSETMLILKQALGATNPTIQERLLEHVFPKEEPGHWIPETIKVVFDNKDVILGALGSLISSLPSVPPQPVAAATGFEDIMRMQPPTAEIPAPTSGFRRRHAEPDAEPVTSDETEIDETETDAAAIDADLIDAETSNDENENSKPAAA